MHFSARSINMQVWYSYRWHVLSWSIYIGYEIFIAKLFPQGMRFFISNYVLYYILNICLFYTHAHLILPSALSNKVSAVWKLPLLLIAEIIAYVSIILVEGMLMGDIELDTDTQGFIFDISGLEYFLIPIMPYLLYSTGYYILTRYLKAQKAIQLKLLEDYTHQIENEQLKNQLLVVEASLLKAQINPHLLYNTLNFINYSARKNPDEADEATQLLASIMRYALEDVTNTGLVPLSKELSQVRNIIRLNYLRFNHQVKIELDVADGLEEVQVLPLLLLTVIENVFKHGDVKNVNFPARIAIRHDRCSLVITSRNLISTSTLPKEQSGKGLINILRTLQIHYPEEYVMEYGPDGNVFSLKLCFPIAFSGTNEIKNDVL